MNTIKQVIDLYKKWTDKKKKEYGDNSNPMESWGGSDYRRIMAWNDTISSMEKILGLTKKEIKKFSEEIGMKC
jgi:hypothetical protein